MLKPPMAQSPGSVTRVGHVNLRTESGTSLILQPLPDQGANPLMLPSIQAGAIAVLVQPPRDAERQLPRILTGRPWSHLPRR